MLVFVETFVPRPGKHQLVDGLIAGGEIVIADDAHLLDHRRVLGSFGRLPIHLTIGLEGGKQVIGADRQLVLATALRDTGVDPHLLNWHPRPPQM